MEKLPITVIVPVRNEEKNLPNMLPLLSEFDEVIVVDSHSTDKTPEIVKSFGYQLVEFEWNGHFPKKRNWTLRNVPIRNEWVFFVDADEFMTPAFMKGLREEFRDTKDFVGYRIKYSRYFMGKKLNHGHPIHKLPLFKKGSGEYEKIDAEGDNAKWSYSGIELHEHPILNGKIGFINGEIDHKENRGLESYINKHNEFSSWEVNRFFTTNPKNLTKKQKMVRFLHDSWFFGLAFFIYIYIFRLGFLDGKAGFIYAKILQHHEFNIKAKFEEYRMNCHLEK